jgi:hypothetical protein
MTIKDDIVADLPTPTGPMRTYVFARPVKADIRAWCCFKKSSQVTGPIRRTATMMAGHGYVVAVPEVYDERKRRAQYWGRQDPHVPLEGRNRIKARLEEMGARFQSSK